MEIETEFSPQKVSQVLFTIENKQDFYRYDVTQSIRIQDLNRMLETALQIPRKKINLFHNQITQSNLYDSRLETLFPTLQTINFSLSLPSSEPLGDATLDNQISFKLRLDGYCDNRLYKYPCHFCFDCLKSFCSECFMENIHSGHETIEKYDYLLDSKVIINRIFRRITDEIKRLKFEKEENVQKFSAELTQEFFDKLRNLIYEIETRIKKNLNVYLESSKNSLKPIEINLLTLKENCAVALEQRKSQLKIENMLIDESVIVNYYNAIVQIYSQKLPIEKDKVRFAELINSLAIGKPVAEGLFYDIKQFLTHKLNFDAFAQCEKEILRNKIAPISKEDVLKNIKRNVSFFSDAAAPEGDGKQTVQLLGEKEKGKNVHRLAITFETEIKGMEFDIEEGNLNWKGFSAKKDKGFGNDRNIDLQKENFAGFVSGQLRNAETSVRNVTHFVEVVKEGKFYLFRFECKYVYCFRECFN